MKMAQVREQYGLPPVPPVPVVGSAPVVPIKTSNNNDNNNQNNKRTEKLRNKYEQICDNILCPDIAALALTEKPAMEVVNHLLVTVTEKGTEHQDEEDGKQEQQPKQQRREPLFQIPEYFSVPSVFIEQQQEEEENSLNCQLPRVQSFCDRIGYPVLVKGEQHGATFCYSWSSVATTLSLYSSSSSSSSCCFIQKYIEGVEKTIAFAAVDGVLTGAVMMTKAIITPEGKVWSGRLSAVGTDVMEALKSFVHSSRWTGGGELEFIETTPTSITTTTITTNDHPKKNKKNWFLIDCNPRFPSWIFACVYINDIDHGNDHESDSCCNLVADLVKQAIEFKKNKQQGKIYGDSTSFSSITNDHDNRTRLDRYLGLSAVSFTKSVIELPDLNYSTGIFGKNWMSRFYQSLSSSSGSSVVMGKYGEKGSVGGIGGGGGGGAMTVTVQDNNNSNNKQKNGSSSSPSSHCKDNDPLSPHTPNNPPLTAVSKELREALASISNLIMKSESGSSSSSCPLPSSRLPRHHSQHNKNSSSNGFIVLGNENLKNKTETETESNTTICDSFSSSSASWSFSTTTVAVAPIKTPCYLILSDIIRSALSRHKSFISRAIERSSSSVSPALGSLSLSLCVSVKTQPIKEVLRLAREFGYSAECISLAEVKAALEAGFSEEEIVLTGPGKLWTVGNDEKDLLRNYYCREKNSNNNDMNKNDSHSHSHVLHSSRQSLSFTFGAIFADSVMDLFRLLQRINDPYDWLKTKLLGIRFQPAGLQGTPSRFGINVGDPIVLRLVAGMIRHYLPPTIQLGVQFHYAITAPNNGIKKWIGMTESFLVVVKELSELSGRSVEVIDFGGGWQPSFSLEEDEKQQQQELQEQDKEEETDPINRSSSSSCSSSSSFFSNELTSLFDFLRNQSSSAPFVVPKDNNNKDNKNRDSLPSSSLPPSSASPPPSSSVVVQFELGKCITERSGFLLCRVMEIREIQFFHDPKSLELLNNCENYDNNNSNDKKSFDEAFQSFLLSSSPTASFSSSSSTMIPKGRRAIVIDGSIAEISSPHFHPIFWRSSSFSSPSCSSTTYRPTDSVTGRHTGSHTVNHGWKSFTPGEDEIWGRTCMEFDQIVGRVSAWGTGSGRTGMGSQCIAVPLEMKVGDFVLIGNCGSYDMSMSFGFADGQGRKENCRVL
jgi:diaminopimelate decarboxylase